MIKIKFLYYSMGCYEHVLDVGREVFLFVKQIESFPQRVDMDHGKGHGEAQSSKQAKT